jgi:hypothetical protein
MPPRRQPATTTRARQQRSRQPPLDVGPVGTYRDQRRLRTPVGPPGRLRQKTTGRAYPYYDVITLSSHTNKGNPIPELPSTPSRRTTRTYPHVLIRNDAQHLQPRSALYGCTRSWLLGLLGAQRPTKPR